MNRWRRYLFCASLILLCCCQLTAQSPNLIYVDKEGVIRWTKDKKEASFFGVNYTVPFAYGYRSHKALGKELKKAIDEDVYHLSRLSLDAFRVHMWDVEITDSLGNLLQNEHLDLFDYLLFKLKERNIYTLITPIAFWGNGYPERDEKTPGFATKYGKGQSVVNEDAIKAQENYLRQLFQHVNPYTKTTYRDDQHIIAAEINNEPHHSGPKEKTTEYVNRLAAAVRNTGWTKPVFYNISESPTYSDAIAKAKVEGHSFQWYPSGLVANREQKGNFLPHVDRYTIPFDSVPEYRNKARMVYEFDAADIYQSYMYPAMARSYRTAGFQWATQFAYDPLATAYGNTEYQTHFLNLVYTPAKAISLLIASKVFHVVPRGKDYGLYPRDTTFDSFRVSYKDQLSEMNSDEEFYYSNSTTTKPKNISRLKHIAGVGSSPVIQYEGNGAYFLDKIREGVWRLEVMPDAIQLRDPFERASPQKELLRIDRIQHRMTIKLPGDSMFLIRLDYMPRPQRPDSTGAFLVLPAIYLLKSRTAKTESTDFSSSGYVSWEPFSTEIFVSHLPLSEVSSGRVFTVTANIVGIDTSHRVNLELRGTPRWRTIPLKKTSRPGEYTADVPADAVQPGILNYRIIIQKGDDYIVYPGNTKGNPFRWDNTVNDTYQTIVASESSGLEIFNVNVDRANLTQYNTDWRNNSIRFVPAETAQELAVSLNAKTLTDKQSMGLQFYFGDKIKGRLAEMSTFRNLVIKLRSQDSSAAKIILISQDAFAFSAMVNAGKDWTELRIPLSDFKVDSMLLLPRPYPGFLPLWFKASGPNLFKLEEMEKFQVIVSGRNRSMNFEIAKIWLEK